MTMQSSPKDQLGFDALLLDAAEDNQARMFERETAHLPCHWEEAIECHRGQIDAHHAAMLAMDFDAANAIRKDAHLLARKLNGGKPGILAGKDAPGCVLARECAADDGAIPLWGQDGAFVMNAAGMDMRVEMDGVFGVGASSMPFLGFSVRCVDPAKPFLSETGFRSFLGCTVEPQLGMTIEDFVRRIVEFHVSEELKGKLIDVSENYRDKR